MSSEATLGTAMAVAATAAFLIASVLIGPAPAEARDEAAGSRSSQPCQCPEGGMRPDKPWKKPHFADHQPGSAPFDSADELAVLEAIHVALSEVGDGSTFVWQRQHGRLSGMFHPTSSFKDRGGRICRHLVVMLTAIQSTKRIEGVACRERDGSWTLEG